VQILLKLHHESLVSNPLESLERISKFIELENPKKWIERVQAMKLYDGNKKSTVDSGNAQTQMIENIQADMLIRYGYRCESSSKEEQ
jgi:hypothetical protein